MKRVVSFKIHFLTCFSFDHNQISMANANIDALYNGSFRIKIAYFLSEQFSFYKWCITKVAHCILVVNRKVHVCNIFIVGGIEIYSQVNIKRCDHC